MRRERSGRVQFYHLPRRQQATHLHHNLQWQRQRLRQPAGRSATRLRRGRCSSPCWATAAILPTGYSFAGWNTQAGGQGTGYIADETFTMGTADTTLYAVWTNTAPVITISNPAGGATYTFGDSITFSGTASDSEQGSLSSGLAWTSDINGSIGSGSTFSTANLSVGTHTITAAVTDGGGLSGSSQVSLTVIAVIPLYTVTYSGNGSTGGSVPVDLNGYEEGAIITSSAIPAASPAPATPSAGGTHRRTGRGQATMKTKPS